MFAAAARVQLSIVVGMGQDHSENIMHMIAGEKEFLLFRPAEEANLHYEKVRCCTYPVPNPSTALPCPQPIHCPALSPASLDMAFALRFVRTSAQAAAGRFLLQRFTAWTDSHVPQLWCVVDTNVHARVVQSCIRQRLLEDKTAIGHGILHLFSRQHARHMCVGRALPQKKGCIDECFDLRPNVAVYESRNRNCLWRFAVSSESVM